MYYRVLGPLAVDNGDGPLQLGGPRQQTVLAVLLCHVGQTVAQDALIDAVWASNPPKAARATLQGYVYGLRQELGSEQIQRTGGGYLIDVEHDAYDALRFEELVDRGRLCLREDPARARGALAEALDLWYGAAFGGLDDNPVVMTEATRLRELRLVAVEQRIEAELLLGNHDGVVGELRTLVREHPLRERFRAQQMVALYRSGRQAEALAAYQRARDLLGEELGLDPSSELRDLEQRILAQDPSLMHHGDAGARSGPGTGVASQAPSPDTPVPGRSLRGYELRNALGQGDFGTVLRAFQPSVGREVAIKVIRPEYANRPAFVERFEREAQIVAQLEHPHIVPLFDYWRDPHGAYLVMPLLRGGNLAIALRRGGWNLAPALRAIEQVAGALAHAHRRGVVHRDVKPGNVLLDEEGNAYLSDFGIAVRLSDDSEIPLTTSLAYVPPEELRGEPQTAQSDLFALGVLTYQLVTGVAPPASGALPAVTRIRPELPAALDEVLARATDDNPARRHDRVEAFLRDLRRSVGTDVVEVSETPPVAHHDEPIRNPYKGLRAFRETDAADFFGRDAMVDELLGAVATHNLVTVVGPSGSGKSSLVRAGLVPRLRAGGVPGSRGWLVTDMFPGSYPFEELEAALRRIAVDPHDSLLEELLDPHGLLRVTKQLVPDDDSTVLLIVDQFEELFSAVRSDRVRRLFLDNLTSVASDERTRVRVILTLRADFFDRPLQHAEFATAMAPGVVTVGPPSRDGIAQAIAAPARGVGVDLEPGLVGRIIADVEDQPGALPLLQYTLTELFGMRDGEGMTVADYERTGGVTSSLGRRAEELYESLPDAGRQAARDLFLRLVTVEEGSAETRRRAALAELHGLAVDQEAMDHVLHEFGSFRLLSFDRDPTTRGPTVEVAHEALLGEWDRLRRWIDERREGLVLARRIAMAAHDWNDAGHDPSFLLRGARLEQAVHWRDETDLALTTHELEYIDASLARRTSEHAVERRRRRRALFGLLVGLVLVSILAVVAMLQRDAAHVQARDARVRELAGEAVLALEEDPELATLIALEAVDVSRAAGSEPLPEAVGALQQTVQQLRLLASFDTGGPLAVLDGRDPAVVIGGLEQVTMRPFNANGPAVVLAATDGNTPVAADDASGLVAVGSGPEAGQRGVSLYDDGGQLVEVLASPGEQFLYYLDIAPGGGHLVGTSCPVDAQNSCTTPPTVHVWDRASGTTEPLELEGLPGELSFVNESMVAIATNVPAGVALHDLQTGATRFVPVEDGPVDTLAVSPGGTRVAVTGTRASAITLVDVEAAEVAGELPSARELGLDWSPDGASLAATGFTGIVRIIDVASGEVHHHLRGADDNLFHARFSPDGDRVLAASFDRTWMWDVSRPGPAPLGAIAPTLGPTFSHALSPDGELLVAFSVQQGLEVVDVTTGAQVAAAAGVTAVDAGVNVPDDEFRMIGAMAGDGTSVIRALPDLSVLHELPDCSNALAFSSDGRLALVSGGTCPGGAGNAPPPPAHVLDLESGDVVFELERPWAYTATFVPGPSDEADRYLVVNDQTTIDLYDMATEERLAAFSPDDAGPEAGGFLSTLLDASGRYLASGMSGGRVWVLDVPALLAGGDVADATVFSQVVHTGAAPVPAISSDGVLATAGFDELVRLWDLESGALLTEFRIDLGDQAPAVSWTPDERELLYPDAGVLRRFPRELDDLIAIADGLVTRNLTRDECLRHLGPQGCDP